MGLRLRAHLQLPGRVRDVPAPQDRGGRRAAARAHRARRRLRPALGRRRRMTGLDALRRLPLRSRLALLTAVAVAVAVAAVGRRVLAHHPRPAAPSSSTPPCATVGCGQSGYVHGADRQPAPAPRADGTCASSPTPYTVAAGRRPTGTVCTRPEKSPIPRQRVDVAVAEADCRSSVHTHQARTARRCGSTPCPTAARSPTPAATASRCPSPRPWTRCTDPLNHARLVLLIVAGVGVLGAATAGLWIARAGLRPVDRLTEAVEHVARTEDLAVRIPAEGEDEIARLSRSFNSMTAALAASRDRPAAADRGRRARTAHPAHLAAHQHRPAGPQRARPAAPIPAGGPRGAAVLGEGADDASWPRSSATSRSSPARTRAPAAGRRPGRRAARDRRDGPASVPGCAAPTLTITRGAATPGTYAPSPPPWSGRWSTSWTTR